MLRIEIESRNGLAMLRCSGRLVFGVEVEMLRTVVLSRPEACLRIHLSAINQIDAAGLGLLMELQNWAKKSRRSLTLLDLSEQVWALLILTKLCGQLDISYSDPAWGFDEEDDECGQREMIA